MKKLSNFYTVKYRARKTRFLHEIGATTHGDSVLTVFVEFCSAQVVSSVCNHKINKRHRRKLNANQKIYKDW